MLIWNPRRFRPPRNLRMAAAVNLRSFLHDHAAGLVPHLASVQRWPASNSGTTLLVILLAVEANHLGHVEVARAAHQWL